MATVSQETNNAWWLSPEIIMLAVAAGIDSEIIIEHIPYVGQVLSVIMDIVGLVFIGSWMWFRSSAKSITVPRGTGERIAKLSKWAKRLKWIRPLCIVIEMIPIFSSYLPLWILVVWFELKYN